MLQQTHCLWFGHLSDKNYKCIFPLTKRVKFSLCAMKAYRGIRGIALHTLNLAGDRGGTAVKVLCYKSEDR